jgi:hypothetical protein
MAESPLDIKSPALSRRKRVKTVLTDLQQDTIVDRSALPRILSSLNKGTNMPTAYSYIRFSSKKQELNDSVKRQTRLRDDWLRQNPEMTLDTTISLQDLGVSAFRGRNLDPEWGDLGKFIDLAERPDSPIASGSYLLLERLDRFSRQRVSIAYTALVRLVSAGIKVVVLDPVAHQINKDNIDQLHVVLPIVTNLCLAHEQSREKSKRVSYAWLSRREKCRDGKQIYTKRTPAWIYYDAKTNSLKLNNDAAKAIKHIFTRTCEGIGQIQLVKELNQKFKPFTKKKPKHNDPRWNTAYISKILNDRSVLGEFQPHTSADGKVRIPDGEPLRDYFPRVISDELFYEAQYHKSLRKKEKSANESNFINLFTGIVFNTLDQHVMQVQTSRTKRPNGEVYLQRRMWSYGSRRGVAGSCPWGIDYYPFETVMLHALSELKPEDFKDPFVASDERAKIHQQIEGIEIRIKELEKSILDLKSSDSATRISRLIDELVSRKNIASYQLDSLVGASDRTSSDMTEALKSIATVCNRPDSKLQQNVRNKIKWLIPTIVSRIELVIYRRPNNTKIATAKLHLRNNQERIVRVRKTQGWKHIKHVVFYDKNRTPVYLICPVGSVLWSPFHGSQTHKGRVFSDKELKKAEQNWHDIRWVAVDGNLIKINDTYLGLLHDYLQDEEEDFDSSSCDWSSIK